MDLKLLLSPAQKDPEPDSEFPEDRRREEHAPDDAQNWQYHPDQYHYNQQQQRQQEQEQEQEQEQTQEEHQYYHQQHQQQQQQQHVPAQGPYYHQGQQYSRPHNQQPRPYYQHQGQHEPQRLNLSSYSFLLMEKRDREREAMERANRGYLMGELSHNKNESASSSPRIPSPRIEPAHRAGFANQPSTGASSSFGADTRHNSYYQLQQPGSERSSYGYPPDTARQPPHGYESPSQYHGSGSYHQQHPSYQSHGPAHSPPMQYNYQQHTPQQQYPYQQPQPHQHPHHYHSSSSANIGQESLYGHPQDYPSDSQGPASYTYHPSVGQYLHHRAMSPGLMDKPRFANSNLSVFRQSAAEDSDGNASVSSNGSLKRRRRPNKAIEGKRSLLPGSTLGTSHGGLGHYLMSRTSSHGSAEGHEDFYDDDDDDDDSLDEQFDVRNGLQGLNLQKTTKSSAPDRAKKSRKKTERPFKIGELVESMKSDTDGTWFAGRVLDLEDDPHDHINPKSVLIHFEGFSPHHDEWVKPSQLRACSTGSSFLRYGPNGHEPAENWVAYEKFYQSDLGRIARRHTGLAYDRRMLLHKCQCNTNPEERHHPEQPERLVEILCQFQKHGMLSLVKWIQGREATIEELVAAHTDTHVRNYCCTAAQNRQYAREHGIVDPDLQTEDDAEDEAEEEGEEEEGEEDMEGAKKTERRGRPKKAHRGSIHVATTATAPDLIAAAAAETAAAAPAPEDVEMAQSTSPTDLSKDSMEVDLHSPALGRRRSSMRGSAIRMSSLVSMSSTLFAQKEEDVPDEVKEAALVIDDDDDDDEKAVQAGPAPSEAALAVAGGMDPTLAGQIAESPQPMPKAVHGNNGASKGEPLIEDKNNMDPSLVKAENRNTVDETTTATPSVTKGPTEGDTSSEKPKLGSGISSANVIEGDRLSSRSMQGQSGATALQIATSALATKDQDTGTTATEKSAAESSKERKAAEKNEKAQKDSAVTKTPTKKKGHHAVSPAPAPSGDAVVIRPPGLTFTMSCGQLGIAVDTTWNPFHSSTAAKVAAGSLINLVDQVVTGRIKNGFAIIRPPGHHAEEDEAMGFCFFNNVGVAVNLTLSRYPLTVQKILIIDWDVHHGNGTQQIFYENPNVLYISLHRWDNGHFYPFTGAPDECGEEAGEGTNVNIAWSSYGRAQAMGDVEYIAAFWYVLLPIARQFQPDLVFVSAGFDAADGHAANIGGYTVSPQGFAILTRLVQTLAGGRVILSLEGGYEFEPLALSATACLEELLPHSLLPATAPTRAFPYASFQGTLNSVKPNAMAVSSLHQVLKYQQKYWKFPPEVLNPSFRFQLPAEWRASNSLATRPRRERNTRRKAPALDS
ncbi:Histone deacetylase 4 [Gamsiella multidivaricata]|nr:Histone deacetylase 4 [Gamsiella multidivaricata]